MADAPDYDPWGNFYFSFELDKVEVAHFLECSGLKTSAAVFEIEEGGATHNVHKRTGMSKWENIVLKKAVAKDHTFAEWRDKYLQAPSEGWKLRTDTTAAIVLRNNKGEEIRRYTILQPFPVSWEGPSLSGGGSDLSSETLEIAHQGILIDMEAPPAPPEPPPQPPEKLETKPVNFEFDQPKDPEKDRGFTPAGQEAMDDTAEQLNEHPEVEQVYVEGHTCDLGDYAYNKNLSARRAKACRLELEDQAPGKDYFDAGYGWDYPVQDNKNEALRAQNRRVDFYTTERSGKRPGEKDYHRFNYSRY